jgi:hypothetical protein
VTLPPPRPPSWSPLSDLSSFLQRLANISMEKSRFLHSIKCRQGGAVDHGCLDAVEAKVQRLRGELEDCQRMKEQLHQEARA